jgi:hypothetical protein
MGGQLINCPISSRQKGFAIQVDLKTNASRSNPYAFELDPNCFKIKRSPASFHLPEVCRQIYSEAALTAYQQNVFLFNGPLVQTNRYFNRLMAVQRRAIKSVEIGAVRLYATMRGLQVVPMTDKLPNLKYILVSAPALKYAQYADELQNSTNKDWQIAVSRRLREVEGDNIKVEFEK